MSKQSKWKYGDKIEVWTFTGWEIFDWGAYESMEDAYEALNECSTIRLRPQKNA